MDRSSTEGGAPARVRVWDAPVRIVHWLLVLLLGLAWWTAEEGHMDWHYRAGLAILSLLVFRIAWGLIGSSTARFSSFVKGPRGMVDYLRGRSEFVLGHNPLGALSVLALLGMIAVQVGLGLFAADEDGIDYGPLSHLVDFDLAEDIAGLHAEAFTILQILVALHVAAILFYLLVRRRNLVTPMLTGRTKAPRGTEPMHPAGPLRFLLAAALAAASVYAVTAA